MTNSASTSSYSLDKSISAGTHSVRPTETHRYTILAVQAEQGIWNHQSNQRKWWSSAQDAIDSAAAILEKSSGGTQLVVVEAIEIVKRRPKIEIDRYLLKSNT